MVGGMIMSFRKSFGVVCGVLVVLSLSYLFSLFARWGDRYFGVLVISLLGVFVAVVIGLLVLIDKWGCFGNESL